MALKLPSTADMTKLFAEHGNIIYTVNDKSRMCQMLFNPSKVDIAQSAKEGFRIVSMEEQEVFRAETKLIKKAKGSK